MTSRVWSSRGVTYWIVFLVIVLLAVNLAAFKVYQKSHWAPTVSAQLWKYGESAVFRVVTVSLILPILLLLLQTVFNVRGAIEERIEREKTVRRERRLECINLTAKMWNQLYDLTNEVRHFRHSSEDSDGIYVLIKRIGSFANRGEDVVRLWRSRLDVSEAEEESSLTLINTMLHATQTVAHAIAEGDGVEERETLKDCLGVIQEGVKTVAHQQILSVLTCRADLLSLMEIRHASEREKQARAGIEERLHSLREWAEALKAEEITTNPILSTAHGPEIEDFRQRAEQLLAYIRDNPGKALREFEGFAQFSDSFKSIPDREVLRASNIQYSKQLVRDLARWFARELTCVDLVHTAKWQRRIGYAAVRQPD